MIKLDKRFPLGEKLFPFGKIFDKPAVLEDKLVLHTLICELQVFRNLCTGGRGTEQRQEEILYLMGGLLHPRGFPCGSAVKESSCNAGDLGSIPGLGRSPGEGKGYPLQCAGLEKCHRVGHN